MRLAIQESFPNRYCAETELEERLRIAAENLNWEVAKVITSKEINDFQPDCVLPTNATCPKLTQYVTVGIMTYPPAYLGLFRNGEHNILTYDGYLSASDKLSRYLLDLTFSTGKTIPIADFHFQLSCPRTELKTRKSPLRRLMYLGARWDKTRHGSLFENLAKVIPFDVYGPPKSWTDLPQIYRGLIPFDGYSILERIHGSGAALCIHSDEHRACDILTMRIWETVAAGGVVITDAVDFGREHFGDAFLYLDVNESEQSIEDQIVTHMRWINEHPEKASQMTKKAHAIFLEKFCLEVQLSQLPKFLEAVREVAGYSRKKVSSNTTQQHPPVQPKVEYIVRAGTRPTEVMKRCLLSLKEQSYDNIGVILVNLSSQDVADQIQAELSRDFSSIKVIPGPRNGIRSNALWAGLRNVTAPFFAILDDDDRLHPNHVQTVMELLLEQPEVGVVHAGGIRVQEEEGFYEEEEHFEGHRDRTIEENRRLIAFGNVDEKSLIELERQILSHAWIARTKLLELDALADPELPALEDIHLLSNLMTKTRFGFTWRPTAEWFWRSKTKDNVQFQEKVLNFSFERIRAARCRRANQEREMVERHKIIWIQEQLRGKQVSIEFLYEQIKGEHQTDQLMYQLLKGPQ